MIGRCEDAYSFARTNVMPSSGPTGVIVTNAVVFTPDYYFFSEQVCASQPYNPGFQASDNLRLSNLNVGQTYYYAIRASSRIPWRNSNYEVLRHAILWQASIDGKVTLSQESGGLPVRDVIVEYRLRLPNAAGSSPCGIGHTATSSGWCKC
jgi:hypothetical protein